MFNFLRFFWHLNEDDEEDKTSFRGIYFISTNLWETMIVIIPHKFCDYQHEIR